jgi:tetratricopeptide (TPR) repeat protein
LAYHAAMRSAWIVEAGAKSAPEPIETEETHVASAAADLFGTGYAAIRAGNIDAAAALAKRIDGHRDSAAHGPLCEQGSGYDTSKQDLLVAEVLQKSLLALVELERGHTKAAVALLDEATAIEGALPLEFGPPIIVKPSHELYGEVLMGLGRQAEAKEQFERALERAPRRSLALAGLAGSASAIGDTDAVARACGELTRSYTGADAKIEGPDACVSMPALAKH